MRIISIPPHTHGAQVRTGQHHVGPISQDLDNQESVPIFLAVGAGTVLAAGAGTGTIRLLPTRILNSWTAQARQGAAQPRTSISNLVAAAW